MLKKERFIEYKMDMSIWVPFPELTLEKRFDILREAEVKYTPYDSDVTGENVNSIVDKIVNGFHQSQPTYILQGRGCNFEGGGSEKVIAFITKTDKCELYGQAVDVAGNLGIPVFDNVERANSYFRRDVSDSFCNFSAELSLINGVLGKNINGGDSDAYFFVLPNYSYVKKVMSLVERFSGRSLDEEASADK